MAKSVNITRLSAFAATSEVPNKIVQYSVVLSEAPVQNVTVKFTSSDTTEGSVDNPTITFTPSNWNAAQTLTIRGVDDFLDDGSQAYSVTGAIITEDLYYNRVTVPVINISNLDDGEDKNLVITGTADTDYISGKNGSDRIYGSYGQDDLKGSRGDDQIFGEGDEDRLFGEEGNDKLYGGYENDKLDGGVGNDRLFGEYGLDTLLGGTGNDILDGGVEEDSMVGGAGNDTYYVDNTEDVIADGGTLADIDTVIVTQNITYTLAAGIENAQTTALGDSNITGNTSNNSLAGNDAKNILNAGMGADSLSGGGGADGLLGGDGNDELSGGAGNDTLSGGTGVDCADFEKAGVSINVNLVSGKAVGEGTDLLIGIENICAGSGNDTLAGSTTANEIEGGAGKDNINAGAGNDTLTGCAEGANGGKGEVDKLTGGAGVDYFELGWSGGCYYNDGSTTATGTSDYALITDFQVGVDYLQLDGAYSNYYIGVGVSGVKGYGVWYEQGAKDELIAVVQSTTTVTISNTISVAYYV